MLARRSWRYEKVRPPFHGDTEPGTRKITASALQDGLAHPEFWDGEDSVKLLTEVHLAAAAGFLAVVLGVTAKLLTFSGPAHWIGLWWIAIGAGGVAIAGAVGYLSLDALGGLTDAMRRSPVVLLIVGMAALVSAGVFAWLQPAAAGGSAAGPGMLTLHALVGLALIGVALLCYIGALTWVSTGRRRGSGAGSD